MSFRSYGFLVLSLLACGLLSAQNLIMLAGGGAEGDQGDTGSWSYQLYSQMTANGDTNGDNIIKVAILTTSLPSAPADKSWLPDYFEWIGTTQGLNVQATNYEVATPAQANDASTVGAVGSADVIFVKGGDQGEYYDFWNGSLLETQIRAVANRGGAVGGTSAGAMSQSEYCFCGGNDLISADVMENSHTPYLDDLNGGSGIHTDFLGFVSGVVVDTHFTQRGRLGRLLGILAKARDDFSQPDILAIGIERETGLVINGNIAEVRGIGSVSFIRATSETQMNRTPGKPLVFSDLRLDRLTAGWFYDLAARVPLIANRPAGTTAIVVTPPTTANSGALSINGNIEADKNKFAFYGAFNPNDYSRLSGTGSPYIRNSVGFTDVANTTNRAEKHETLFRLLYDVPTDLGVLTFAGGTIARDNINPDVLNFSGFGSILVDLSTASYKGLSPYPSAWAIAGGSLKAAAFVDSTLHVLADSTTFGKGYDTVNRSLVTLGGGTGGETIDEGETNDSRSQALDLSNYSFPLNISGTIQFSSDVDYFKLTLAPGQSLTAGLSVPAGVDFDLYFLDSRGRTLTKSVNDGVGQNEALSYNNSTNKTNTYYVEITSWSGTTTTAYNLTLSK